MVLNCQLQKYKYRYKTLKSKANAQNTFFFFQNCLFRENFETEKLRGIWIRFWVNSSKAAFMSWGSLNLTSYGISRLAGLLV